MRAFPFRVWMFSCRFLPVFAKEGSAFGSRLPDHSVFLFCHIERNKTKPLAPPLPSLPSLPSCIPRRDQSPPHCPPPPLPPGTCLDKLTTKIWNAESDHSFLQHLPPPPSWKPESIVVSALGEEGTATAELSPPPPSRSSGSGNCSSAVGRAGGDLISSKPRTTRIVAVSPRPGRSFSPPSSPKGGVSIGGGPQGAGSGAGGRLSGGVRGDDDGTARGFGKAAGADGSGAEEKDTAWRRLARWVGSSSGSTVVGGGGGTSAAAAKLAAVASAGSSMSYSRWFPGSRLSPGSEQSGASLSPTPWSRRRGTYVFFFSQRSHTQHFFRAGARSSPWPQQKGSSP